jgi:hypothetical protein
MAKAPHKKPTRPFGTIVFGKDGSVRRKVSQLSEVKVAQEQSVIESFCNGLKQFHGRSVGDIRNLAERDHDASAVVDGRLVQLQVAEIVQRGFELPAGAPNRGDPKAIAFFDATSKNATSLNIDEVNDSVVSAIERKLQKHYAKPTSSALWLVLFTTSSFIPMEYLENGRLTIGEPLRRVREHFRAKSWQPFDEVWFTDLRTRPVQVLPSEPQ